MEWTAGYRLIVYGVALLVFLVIWVVWRELRPRPHLQVQVRSGAGAAVGVRVLNRGAVGTTLVDVHVEDWSNWLAAALFRRPRMTRLSFGPTPESEFRHDLDAKAAWEADLPLDDAARAAALRHAYLAVRTSHRARPYRTRLRLAQAPAAQLLS